MGINAIKTNHYKSSEINVIDNVNSDVIKLLSKNICLISNNKNWIDTSAIDQINNVALLPNVNAVSAMPDLHPGRGYPIGATTIVQNHIFPHLIGNDIGCGMAFFELNKSVYKFNRDKFIKKLSGLNKINIADLVDNNISKISSENFDATMGVSQDVIIKQNLQLGSIGTGNHFAEIQQWNEIIDLELFKSANLKKHNMMLLVHCGSRSLGNHILEQHLQNYNTNSILANSDNGQKYLMAHDYAIEWAKLNRSLVMQRICRCLGIDNGLLQFDIAHNFVEKMALTIKEQLKSRLQFNKNDDYYVHRKGATSSTFNSDGVCDLKIIPGSRGTLSYLVKPIHFSESSENLAQQMSLFSLAHGAGRKWDRQSCKKRLEAKFINNELINNKLGSKLICRDKNLFYQESPYAYKNIENVINSLVDAGLVKIVATLKPVITYKTDMDVNQSLKTKSGNRVGKLYE